MITSCKNWYKQVNTQKSTNNPMSSFDLIEKNMELSHIHLAVAYFRRTKTISWNSYFLCIRYMDRYCKESFRTLLLDWCLGMIIIRSRQKKISQKQIITCFLTLAQLNTYCMDLQKCDVHNGTITCLKLHFLKKKLTVSVLCSI